MEVPITRELKSVIDSEVRSGRFRNAVEFLTTAVHHFVIARDLGETYTRAEIEEKIARGLAQIERGESIDGDEAFRRLRAHSAERRRGTEVPGRLKTVLKNGSRNRSLTVAARQVAASTQAHFRAARASKRFPAFFSSLESLPHDSR